MTPTFQSIREWRNVDLDTFRNEIVPNNEPAVLRGLVRDWPAVREGLKSPRAMADYLKPFDNGRPMQVLEGAPEIQGRFFYTADMSDLNFAKTPTRFDAAIEKLITLVDQENPPAVYIQSIPTDEHLPEFPRENRMPLLDAAIAPRIWIGNEVMVQTHFDLNDNIACVAAGRRRFTLFPPDQIANLYVGPFDFTLAGPPVSMVSLEEPDLQRYPRFAEAMATGRSAELEPGDAIYIPYFWWHHVQSLTPFNVLINYWWNDNRPRFAKPFDALLHALVAFNDLSQTQRDAWRHVFDYIVFRSHGSPLEHLPPDRRGYMGEMTPHFANEIRQILMRQIGR